MVAFGRMTYFHEDQYFRRSWLWLAIAVVVVACVVALAAAPRTSPLAIVLTVVVGVLVTALVALARLETTVAGDRVTVAFHGLWPTRRVALGDITEFAPMHYTIWDSGGWGVHLGLAGIAYNTSGNEGIRFRLTDGRRVLVGTQHPSEFAAAVTAALAARAG